MKRKILAAVLLLAIPLGLWIFFIRQDDRPEKLPRRYGIEALRDGDGTAYVFPRSINSQGQVVGLRSISSPGSGFYWNRETGFRSWENFEAFAINDHGQIDGRDPKRTEGVRMMVGATETIEIARQVRFAPSENNNLGESISEHFLLRSQIWDATGNLIDINAGREPKIKLGSINDHGIAVGTLASPEQTMILRDQGGSIREIKLSGVTSVRPTQINNRGQVAGGCIYRRKGNAFIWSQKDGITFYGEPHRPDTSGYHAWGLNDSGQVVGERGIQYKLNGIHQVLLKSGRAISSGLNRWLYSNWPTFPSSAFLWENDVLYDLNWFLPEDSEWERLEAATDINNRGEIVGVGVIEGEKVGFLMTPDEGDETNY